MPRGATSFQAAAPMLKSLQLAGFKSFADKTRFEFPEGVTVVVGPNGSGKSNVVDAIKWVLGSQSPRSLRGSEMTDVIFGGAGERAQLNAAEVTLTFDNPTPEAGGRRWFAIDEPEVRLTRRVYRSGEGEYLINGRASRLRDFRELLAGTGVGAGAYSIIEQGRVDAALQASPLERRVLFEEAAGVSRYRLKKREAEKRLERVEQNLARLSDLADEAEGRLRRVRAQAGKAQRHRERTKQLRQARLTLAVADYRRLVEEDRRLEHEHTELTERLEETNAAAETHREKLASLGERAENPQALRAATERVAACREEVGRLSARLESMAVQRARLDSAYESARRTARQRQQEAGEDKQREQAEMLAEAERSLAAAKNKQAKLHARGDRLVALGRRVADRLIAARASQARAEQEHQQRKDDTARLTAAQSTLVEQRERLQGELDQLSGGKEAGELAAAIAERDRATEALARIETEAREARSRSVAFREQLAACQQRQSQVDNAVLSAQQQLQQIESEEHRLERLGEGVAKLCGEARADLVVGLVADLLHVDADLALMVEAALGAATQDVVVESIDDLLSAYGEQPTALGVRARFHDAHSVASQTAIDRIDLYDQPGVMGRASDFVESAPEHAPLVSKLLGRTWFVDSLSSAVAIRSTVGAGLAFVTTDGEVVHPNGEVTLGPAADTHLAVVRRQQAEACRETLSAAEQNRRQLAEEVARYEAEVASAEKAISDRDRLLREQRDQLSSALHGAATLEERENARLRRATEVRGTLEQTSRQLAESEAELAALGSLEGYASRVARQRRRVERHEIWAGRIESTRAADSALLKDSQEAVDRYAVLVESLRETVSSAASTSREAGSELEELEVARRDLELADLEWLNTSSAYAHAMWKLEAAATQQQHAEASDVAARSAIAEVERASRAVQQESVALSQRLAPLKLRRQQVRMERATIAERMREDYDVELSALVDSADAGEADAVDREALKRQIDELRVSLSNTGPINLAALEELDEVESRFEQLSGQYRDLSDAKTSLVRLTTRINNDTRKLYVSCFEEVRRHFGELFSQFFGGGEADLVMTDDSDDPLESGVEIIASPPGKTLRSISLLSGGEKTLTCVALLLALFRSKPGPFCILDEVDAALDEANVGRFATVLRQFMQSTQFVVVTHSKRTMSAADTLYGVTMQESGVSKQVSVRFEDVGEEGHIRLPERDDESTPPARRAA